MCTSSTTCSRHFHRIFTFHINIIEEQNLLKNIIVLKQEVTNFVLGAKSPHLSHPNLTLKLIHQN